MVELRGFASLELFFQSWSSAKHALRAPQEVLHQFLELTELGENYPPCH
jgi:hypothetical protein